MKAPSSAWLRADRARPLLIGVIHLPPAPGSPRFVGDVEAVLARVRADAMAYAAGGVDAVLVENFGDLPFFGAGVPPETIATLTRAVDTVVASAPGMPVGVNVLRNDARAALGICAASAASFLRVNVHVGVMVTDQGLLEGRAAETLRERARLCPGVGILADVHVKHATPLGGEDVASAAEETVRRGLADAVIVSGRATGHAPAPDDLRAVRERVPGTPLLIGSGLDRSNAGELVPLADGAIVGSSLKRDGVLDAPVDADRVARLRLALGVR